MKVEDGAPPAPETAALRVCGHCRRDVAAANFSLHEAHCRRFLAICPECLEPVALKEMQAHRGEAHRQVRCGLCHQTMQQYLLQHHEAEECPERSAQCRFCNLELPFRKLPAHLEACGSRTTTCWDCGKYVMYRALEDHHVSCSASHGPRATGEVKGHICQQCKCRFPDEQYLQHLNECAPLPRLLGALGPGCPPQGGSATEEGQDVRPKRPEKESPALVGKPTLKPPKGRRGALGRLAFTPIPPQVPDPAVDPDYDQLTACPQCDILLPGPTFARHQKKCLRRQTASVQALRRSPRLLGRKEPAGQSNPSGETPDQP
ncbi:hypothetical protein JRQ81_008230 [Phrynocephalus forsythii]|uniref:TRAF-type domain-containing protein n=1 Tax=Phrynocephalus forsythii TaxID=171643 RepID=A0A9Q1AT06_9SAUR|nr:hypothetical protein JRQ81_008230 [Phrynocephalus forsythii]